jgi:hypothetical protein
MQGSIVFYWLVISIGECNTADCMRSREEIGTNGPGAEREDTGWFSILLPVLDSSVGVRWCPFLSIFTVAFANPQRLLL